MAGAGAAPTQSSPVTDPLNEELSENTSEVRLLSQKVYEELFNISLFIWTQMFRGVFQMRANICLTFKAYNCLRDVLKGRGESDS